MVKTLEVVTAIWTVDLRATGVHGFCVACREVLSRHSGEWKKVPEEGFICQGWAFGLTPSFTLRSECSGVSSIYQAKTLGIFLKKVAFDYARYGYTEYALREIPEGKDIGEVEEKLIKQYRVTRCRMERARRKKAGRANVVLLMHRRWFVLLGTQGKGVVA